jgi:hypothetical protein
MKKKLTILSLALVSIIGVSVFQLNSASAKDEVVQSDEQEQSVVDFWETWEHASEAPPIENLPLTQEEYDDLISRLPEGAVIVSDVEVLPGVVRDPSREKTDSSFTDSSEK